MQLFYPWQKCCSIHWIVWVCQRRKTLVCSSQELNQFPSNLLRPMRNCMEQQVFSGYTPNAYRNTCRFSIKLSLLLSNFKTVIKLSSNKFEKIWFICHLHVERQTKRMKQIMCFCKFSLKSAKNTFWCCCLLTWTECYCIGSLPVGFSLSGHSQRCSVDQQLAALPHSCHNCTLSQPAVKMTLLQDSGFSQRCCWRFTASRMLHPVIG